MDLKTEFVPPQSRYFDKPEINVASDDVLLFCCLRNEAARLPYFLDYYREQGIRHFFIVDNGSNDGSSEFLKEQADVHYFHTDLSYRGSSAGRLWLQELADRYGVGHWCLTVDVDELLVFPGAEHSSIPELCRYLDLEGSEGLYCVFLDMYSDRPLTATKYRPGQPFLDVCHYFETDSYVLKPGGNPPFLNAFGGPRGRSFAESKGNAMGPMMKKVPLVKWSQGFSYIFSTHSHMIIPLSDMTGALLHFKFFDFFTELAAREHDRGDRRQSGDYALYANSMSDETCFFSPLSHRYRRPRDLIELGVMRGTRDFRDFCLEATQGAGPAVESSIRECFPTPLTNPPMREDQQLTIRWVNAIWPFVNNQAVPAVLSNGASVQRIVDRKRYLRAARDAVRILDIDETSIRLKLGEQVIYRFRNPRLSLLCFSDERFLFRSSLHGSTQGLCVDEPALESAVYRVPVDWSNVKRNEVFDLRVYLVADEAIDDDTLRTRPRSYFASILGPAILRVPRSNLTHREADVGLAEISIDGVIERIDEGTIFGWVRDEVTGSMTVPVSIYLNGRLASTVTPSKRRTDLDRPGQPGFVYQFKLPLGYFFENGDHEVEVDVRPVGTSVSLRRGPVTVTSNGSYKWDVKRKEWVEYSLSAGAVGLQSEGTALRAGKLLAQKVPALRPFLRAMYRRLKRI